MDDDDGLMLNFAPAATASSTNASKRPKQTAKERFQKKRNAQQLQRKQAPKQQQQQQQQQQNGSDTASSTASQLHRPSVAAPTRSNGDSANSPAAASSTVLAVPRFDPRSASTKSSASPSSSRASKFTLSTSSSSAAAIARKTAASSASSQKPSSSAATSGPSTPSSSALKTAPSSNNVGKVSALFPAHGVLEPPSSTNISNTPRAMYDPTNAPSTGTDFASCGLDPLLVYHLRTKMKIPSPTSIQKSALPHLLHPSLDRDILIQAQTGSGKTLTYLLPILQSLLPLCLESFIDRSIGTLAIILAPTRELARQIYEVLEKLVSLSLSLKEVEEVRRTRWLVPGLLSGGSTKNHEKQRLRKGCPILVSTPGRLLDHLQNTSSFDVGKCRWLILDEADRLLEMGFEDQLNGIVKALDGRRNLAISANRQAMPNFEDGVKEGEEGWIRDEDVEDSLGVKWWEKGRRVVLCSATLDENVQVLAGKTLVNPMIVRGGKDDDSSSSDKKMEEEDEMQKEKEKEKGKFAAPAQLSQNYVNVPTKLRLVTLVSLLRSYISRAKRQVQEGSGRVIVFMSCTDSVDFHYSLFGHSRMNSLEEEDKDEKEEFETCVESELIPGIPIYRLHGSMTQSERILSLKGFSKSNTKEEGGGGFEGSILLCTSVASRGLDLPSVGCVIQLDAPTEGGLEEYLHRVGRTARVGRSGESWLMVLPQEIGWISSVLEKFMTIQSSTSKNSGLSAKITPVSIEAILQQGFGGSFGTLEYQSRATEVQLSFERWVLSSERSINLARKAFLSHVRAYATHSSEEKVWFNLRSLHLGHLAKSFALREPPKSLGSKSSSLATSKNTGMEIRKRSRIQSNSNSNSDDDEDEDVGSDYENATTTKKVKKGDEFELDKAALAKLTASIVENNDGSRRSQKLKKEAERAAKNAKAGGGNKGETDAEARMYAKVRELGKQSKKHGVLGAHGADEFQIA